jgi:hypothetical protein
MPSLELLITPNFSLGGTPLVQRRATEQNLASASYATISNAVNSVTFATQWLRRLGSRLPNLYLSGAYLLVCIALRLALR